MVPRMLPHLFHSKHILCNVNCISKNWPLLAEIKLIYDDYLFLNAEWAVLKRYSCQWKLSEEKVPWGWGRGTAQGGVTDRPPSQASTRDLTFIHQPALTISLSWPGPQTFNAPSNSPLDSTSKRSLIQTQKGTCSRIFFTVPQSRELFCVLASWTLVYT